MSYNFKKLSTVESVETVSDNANVLIEENGVIKKAPKTEVGGAGGAVFIHYDDDSGSVVAVTPNSFKILKDGFKNSLGVAVFVLKKWSGNETAFTSMRVDYIHLDNSDDEHGRYVHVDAEGLITKIYEDGYFSSFWMD